MVPDGLHLEKGVVCSDLYSISESRTSKGDTLAVRELVGSAIDKGLHVDTVIRFFPLITKRGLYLPRKRIIDRLHVYDVPTVGVKFFYSIILTRMVMWFLGCRLKYRYAVCHMCFNFEAARRLLKCKAVILVVHGSDVKNDRLKKFLGKCESVLARSNALAMQVSSRYGRAVDGILFSGIPERERIDFYDRDWQFKNPLRVVMASSMIPQKNIESSILAVKSLLDRGIEVKVDVYGDGPLRAKIEKLVDELGIKGQVFLNGFQARSDVVLAMKKAHLFLMPSAPETFGLAYLEAMASGCVVIGHEFWGIDGIVEHGVSGYLVAQATPEEISCCILAYLNSDRKLMHRLSWEKSASYTKDAAANNYVALVEKIIR